MTKLTGTQVAAESLSGWAYLLNGLQTSIRTTTFADGLALVQEIGAAAEEMDHHPDLDLRYDHLDIRLTSHDTRAVTERDIALARKITALAAARGLQTESAGTSRLELGLDTPRHEAVAPFWAAALGMAYRSGPDTGDEVRDQRRDALPTIWFQRSGSTEPRQRWHLDLWVDPAEVQPRIRSALAAGGTLVSDAEAPAFWVLADPEGNKVCLCTWQSRD